MISQIPQERLNAPTTVVLLVGLPPHPTRPLIQHYRVQVRPDDAEPVDTVGYDVSQFTRDQAEHLTRQLLGGELDIEFCDLSHAAKAGA